MYTHTHVALEFTLQIFGPPDSTTLMLGLQESGTRFLTCAKGAIHRKMAPEDGEPWVTCYYLSCDYFYFRFQAVEREEHKKIGREEILSHILTPYQHSDTCDSDDCMNDNSGEFLGDSQPCLPRRLHREGESRRRLRNADSWAMSQINDSLQWWTLETAFFKCHKNSENSVN